MIWLSIAQSIGGILAQIAKAKNKPGAAAVIESLGEFANNAVEQIASHLASHPEDGVSVEQFRAKVQEAISVALKTGDEAEERIKNRPEDDDDNA